MCTWFALLGSIVGYWLGYAIMEVLEPLIIARGYSHELLMAELWFADWGLACLLIASIFPLPFKLFTIVAGALEVSVPAFIITALGARWLHFALIPLGLNLSNRLSTWWKS